MDRKKMLIAIFALCLVIGMMVGVYTATRPETSADTKSITVTVIHGDGSSKDFSYKTQEEYLGSVILSEGLVTGEMGEFGLMIFTVDGEEVSWEANQSYWAILIGEEYATTGADGIALEDGGRYSLVYTIG